MGMAHGFERTWGDPLRPLVTRLNGVAAAIARRHALAFEAAPQDVRGPALGRLLGELRTPFENWQAARRKDDGVPPVAGSRAVMLLPGFGTHPARMGAHARALRTAGHRVSDWGLGFNLGPTSDRFDRLCERVTTMARREGEPLVLVGWSLGGIFAREVARRHPEAVRLVITMGTPFSGNRRANNAWRAYQLVAGHSVDDPPVGRDMAVKPPVPTIALWSPRDGIVSPRSACGRKEERDRAIALRCTHIGFAGHPDAVRAVAALVAAGD